MVAIIVRKLHQRQVFLPTLSIIDNTRPQHVFQCLDGSFTLTIHLRVISSTYAELRTKRFVHRLPQI
ncbi:hypothetical protein Hanom_Chr10g00891621 [Helianthus anomalus]